MVGVGDGVFFVGDIEVVVEVGGILLVWRI